MSGSAGGRGRPASAPMRDLAVRLNAECEQFRDEFRSWLRAHLPDPAEPADQDEMYAKQRAWHRALFEGGWIGLDWPAAYGGRGASPLQKYVYYEELSRVRAPRLLNHPAITLVGPAMMHFAAEDLKRFYLPRILSADDVWCQGFSEPGAGSDLASLRTSAHLDGDHWVINGQKIWTTWAMYSTQCALLCRTDPSAPKHRGLSMVIAEMDQPGIEVRPIQQMTGRQEFCEVFFTDAVAPAVNTIGAAGEGWAVAVKMLEFERSDQSYTDYGRLLVYLDAIAGHIGEGTRSGWLTPSVVRAARQQLVELWSRTQLLRSVNLHTAREVTEGRGVGARGSCTKLMWSELFRDIASLGDDLAGPEVPEIAWWDELYLESRSATIFSGTSEIQRNIISERVAGMPRR
jgi:alkylation response protein AidB-like acyl-CoA dehydrogenase